MGEVYRAADTNLKRQVAIKVLPTAVAADSDRLARFQREAEVLAALNHPNIAHIFGLEKVEGTIALVMELVEGPTLADRIAQGAVPLNEALPIAKQIAEAVEAAHEQGIIHRDLKPANIKIRSDGAVKVLDFGLAKAMEPTGRRPDLSDSPTITSPAMTAAGMILGTAGYMSPEQARGVAVNKRTDVWSFGCVFYEMLTGQPSFPGPTVSDTIAKILGREPEWTALPPATPAGVRRLLQRCLEKDHRRRLRDIGDARLDVDDALASRVAEGANRSPVLPEAASWHTRQRGAGLVAIAAVALAGALVWNRTMRVSGADPFAHGNIERLTSDSGLTETPTLSPDGKLIAYASDRSGRGDLDIWVQQTAGGAPLQLTDDPADDQMPDFTPDGTQVVFRSERAHGGVYLVPALGGNARLIAPDGRWPRLSPDGTRVAYWSGQWRGNPSALASSAFLLPLAGGEATRVLADFSMARDPRWAPDGRSVLVLGRRDRTAPLTDSFDWWWVPLDGRPPVRSGVLDLFDWRRETDREVMTLGAWTDSGLLIAERGSLWLVPISLLSGRVDGPPKQLAFGAGQFRDPSTSRDGQIAFAVIESARVLERVPISGNPLPGALTTIFSSKGRGTGRPSQTTDGRTIVFEQNFARYQEIWVKNTQSNEQRMLLRVDTRAAVNPVVSQDGARVGYTVGTDPDRGVGYVIHAGGGVPKQICANCGVHGFLADNRRVLIVAEDQRQILLANVETLTTERLVDTSGGRLQVDRPHASPDDRWLAVRRVDGTRAKVFVIPLTPGRPNALVEGPDQVDEPTTTGRPCGWSPDSRIVYLLLDIDGFRCLWGQHVDGNGRLMGQPLAVRHFHSPIQDDQFSTSYGNSITADGFLYGRSRTEGNVWTLTAAKP